LDFNFCDNFLKNSISSIKTIVPIFKGLGKQTYGEQINKIIRKQIPSLRKRSFRFDIVQVESICFQIVKVLAHSLCECASQFKHFFANFTLSLNGYFLFDLYQVE